MTSAKKIIDKAYATHTAIPAFNIPYLPMMEAVAAAVRDSKACAFITVARLEWMKFKAHGMREIKREYDRIADRNTTRLHLDHIPVIDEDGMRVDYEAVISEALALGYDSVMVDGSRLSFDENIRATKNIVTLAHAHGIPVEAELGAVFGHEKGPAPDYDALFASGRGFTDPAEAKRFAAETNVDWLSVAVGNVHGAISDATRDQKKIAARLSHERLALLRDATGIPLVLHGGSGISRDDIDKGIANGIAKINIATAIRQPYEAAIKRSAKAAYDAVYQATCDVLTELHAVNTCEGALP
ncbi:MAG: class II fructose-bisphosphate aldolase [Spirochaetota bacterium]